MKVMPVKLLLVVLFVIAVPVLAAGAVILLNNLPLTERPGIIARLKTYLTTNTAETSFESLFPELTARSYTLPPEKIYPLAEASIDQLGWSVMNADELHHELHAVVETPVLKFKDDIRISIGALPDRGSVVHIRSQSRAGQGDLGTNTRHILDFYNQLEKGLP
jgi:hypothetical protein